MKKILFLLLFPVFVNAQSTGVFDFNFWRLMGNSSTDSTVNFIGTTNAEPLIFKTNNLKRLYLDYDGKFNWNVPSDGSGAYYNNFSLRPLPTATIIPALYICTRYYRGDNYAILADTTNTVFNANRGFFLRCHNSTFLSAYTSFVNNQTGNADAIQIGGITSVTCLANAALSQFRVPQGSITHSVGTTPDQRDIYLQGATHSAMSASTATITNGIGVEITQPGIGTGMTFTNRLGLSVTGITNIFGGLYLTGSTTRVITTPSAILQLGSGSNTQPALKFTSQTAVSSPNAGEVFYNSSTGFNLQGAMNLSGNATLNGSNTFGTGAGSNTHYFNLGTNVSNVLKIQALVGAETTYRAIYGVSTPTNNNYALAFTTNVSLLNSTSDTYMNVNDGNQLHLTSTYLGLNNPMFIGSSSSTSPNASSVLELSSTTKGFLPTRMTTTQKNGISSPANGLQVYDTDLNSNFTYNGTTWEGAVKGSATLDFPSTGSNATSTMTLSVTGSLAGYPISLGVGATAVGTDNGTWTAECRTNGTITILYHNTGGSPYDPPSDTFRIRQFIQ